MNTVVYFLQRDDGAIKIGYTSQYKARLSNLIQEHGDLTLLGLLLGSRDTESELHSKFAQYRIGHTEFFEDHEGLRKYIDQHTNLQLPLYARTPSPDPIRTKLKELVLQKAAKENTFIRKSDIKRATGLGKPTIARWMDGTVTRFDDKTITALCRFLGCEIGDLLYIDWEGERE